MPYLRLFIAVFIILHLACAAFAANAKPLKVALLLEHDQPSAWTNLLCKGLAEAKDKHNIQAQVIIAAPGPEQLSIFRNAAADHDLVLVASEGLHDILRDNAANYRRVMFGVIDAGIRAPNLMCITFADEQASFLAGATAALLAKPPIIGWLSGMDTAAMRSLFNGYSEGALLASPGSRIVQAVVGSFTDPEKAAQKTKWLLERGAKVITLAAGQGNAAARAVAEAGGAAVIELDSGNGAAVIAKAADKAVTEIIAAAATGNFKGKEIITYNLANKGVDFQNMDSLLKNFAPNPDARRRPEELRRELLSGGIKLHSLRQRTLCDCLD